MRVLSVASECFPTIKTGGLADVVGALPEALKPHGVKMETALPAYRNVSAGPGLHLIDVPWAFDRPGAPYLDEDGRDWPDNIDRFLAFARRAAELAVNEGFDLVHAHDWQAAGLVPFLDHLAAQLSLPKIPVVMTIHNLAFQGQTQFMEAGSAQRTATGLSDLYFGSDWLEFYGHHNLLKAAILRADAVTTVSPTYANEILTPEFGFDLQDILAYRAEQGAMHGILNGLDLAQWNPAQDTALAKLYGPARAKSGKAAQKQHTQGEFDLALDPDAPLLGLVSRLTGQKGIDLLIDASATWLKGGGQILALGSGEALIEERLRGLALAHPNQVAFTQGYNEALSHQIHAASDFMAIPSRFEPCGLTQLSAQRYGSLPIVTAVGGLNDTVIHGQTGLVMADVSASALSVALGQGLELYHQKEKFAAMRQNAMRQDLGWDQSAKAYAALYATLLAT